MEHETRRARPKTGGGVWHRTLRPERALLHPLWLVALATLALNDHVLKGAGLLPGVVTGKLSDVVGLFVAPALLAVLVRARSRGALLACHVAVGAGFAALQLSPEFVAAWSSLMGLVGFPWRVWMDPTDLLTLPALVASWRLLTPALAAPVAVRPRLRQCAEWGVTGVAVLCCVATEPPPPPEVEEDTWQETWQDTEDWREDVAPQLVWDDVEGDVMIHNATDATVALRLRQLRADASLLDCAALATDPGALLQVELFDVAQTWLLPPQTNLPARPAGATRPCYATRVEGDGVAPAVLFWLHDQPGWGWQVGGGAPTHGGVILSQTPQGLRLGDVDLSVSFAPRARPSEAPPEGCVQPTAAERFAWSDAPRRTGGHAIISQTMGLDGCLGVDLQPVDDAAAPTTRWFVCLPDEAAWPYVADDVVAFEPWTSIDGLSTALRVRRVSSAQGETSELAFTISAGQTAPGEHTQLSITLEHDGVCPLVVDACGVVERGALVRVDDDGEQITLRSGERHLMTRPDDSVIELILGHASLRAATQDSCSAGPAGNPADLELITIERWVAP